MPRFDPPLTAAEIDTAFPGQFTNVAPIYAGGQGSVMRVQRPNGTVGALKIYVPDPNAEIERRTDREVDALRRLSRPTLVTLDGHGTVGLRRDQCRYVCTTFIEGVTLATRLGSTLTLTLDATARLGFDLADAIEALWDTPERIVHRDIKPPNIMLANSGRAVLIDLGVARHTTLESLTLTGGTWGTRGYMSPEQAAARKALTCKSDVFALGLTMQQCLAGRHPTGGDQIALRAGGVATASIAVGVPVDVARIIDAMVLRDPNRRPLPRQIMQALQPYARALGRPW